MNEIIAEREIFAVSHEGKKKIFHIVLERPHRSEAGDWVCLSKIEGLYATNLAGIRGIDSWQALGLAMGFVHQLLLGYLEDGGKLYWEEDGEEISLSDLFPQLTKVNCGIK